MLEKARRRAYSRSNAAPQSPEKVMIWGGVWFDGKTDLCFIEGTVDRWVYIETLQEYLVQPHLIDNLSVFQDGAKAHTAEVCWEFIDEKGLD